MSLTVTVPIECPKCHADRTRLETSFGLPGYRKPGADTADTGGINPDCALPVHIMLCPRCHFIEMYHDVS